MGCFSWTKADRNTKNANIIYGQSFKMLIPKEFGGGYIKDHYRDYGDISGVLKDSTSNLNNQTLSCDMYELIAFWNHDLIYYDGSSVKDFLHYDKSQEFPFLKTKDVDTEHNRQFGIEIGCDDEKAIKLKYPLKLVSPNNKSTYEECEMISFYDPNQGWNALSWKQYENFGFTKLLSERKNLNGK